VSLLRIVTIQANLLVLCKYIMWLMLYSMDQNESMLYQLIK
jgi:hypothetical protein